MKFKILREALLKPLQFVIGVVERRQTLPVLSNVLVVADSDGITLTATDLEVELVARVALKTDKQGEITLPARKLLDICRTLPDEAEIVMDLQQDRMQLRSGKSRFTLSTLPAAEFPQVEDIHSSWDFSISETQLKHLIDKTHFSMAQQDVRYYLNGMLVELNGPTLRAVATDGHRLAMCEIDLDKPGKKTAQQVIVPRKGIQELIRLLGDTDAAVHIEVGGNHLRATLPEIRLTTKLIDGRFPDYQKVLPKGGTRKLVAGREHLRAALTRTSILSNEKYRGVRLSLSKNNLKIQSHNPEQEEAEEDLDITYGSETMEIGFNVNYLLDAIAAINHEQIQITLIDSNSSCLINSAEGGDSQYVVMPMRL